MPKILPAEIDRRSQFSSLCNQRGCRVAVEVGTDQGVFAKEFMQDFGGHELICVDNYDCYEWLTTSRMPDLLMAVIALQPFHGRVRIVQNSSVYVARHLPPHLAERVEFVYIDAKHEYPDVQADTDVWWDVLQPGGILAGHDYCNDHPGVMKAVNEFAEFKNVALHILQGDHIPSWYVIKP